MQLLDSKETQSSNFANKRLKEVLEDIVNKIEIQSNFSIRHPDYKPFEIPTEVVERFQNMPLEMQQKYLSLQLQSFLYGIYYNDSMGNSLAPEADNEVVPLDLENNTVLGVDVGFYQRLHESNGGEGYFESGWSVLREEDDGSLAVTKGGLRLHIDREKHLLISELSASVGDSVAIRKPKNLVQNGFYMAVGNLGSPKGESGLVRIYFNLTAEGAVVVMGSLTRRLNEMEIPFNFKVLYNPKDYERHDSGVLYFDKRDYQVVEEVIKTVYVEQQSHFQSQVPLFTLQIARGLGLAEEPDQKFAERESFGMNRCQIVANGLLEAWNQGDNSSEGRMRAILGQFSMLGIDLGRVYLNANSEDIYQCWDIGS